MSKDMKNKRTGSIVIFLVSIFAVLIVLSLDPIAQDIEYHNFNDQRALFGVPNFWNVISNLPFLIVGGMGVYSIYFSHKIKFLSEMKIAYILFFSGVSIVAIGSSYYHLWPSNSSLVFDRLPMTIAFMSLFSIVIAELASLKLGKLLFWPLILFGLYSVLYWYSTENEGRGDLRLYILVQFLPVILISLMLLFFKATFTNVSGYWKLLGVYVFAKILEHYDSQIHNTLVFISGHSIKHVVAAFGIYLLLNSYNNREKA